MTFAMVQSGDRRQYNAVRRSPHHLRSMVTMAVCARAVFLRRVAFFARFAVLLDQRSDFRLVRAFSRFRHRGPKDTNCGAQRDQLQQEGAGEEPGHLHAVSSRIFVAKEYFRKTKCDFITVGSFLSGSFLG